MVKISTGDALAVLRRFNLATNEDYAREIDQLHVSHPYETTTVASLRFKKRRFYIVFDSTAEDSIEYIMDLIRADKADVIGDIIENPNDHITTYALPFKGREVYLFAVRSDKKRLDALLSEKYPDTSRSTWQKHIKAGHVSVNGTVRVSPKYDTVDSDDISIDIPQQTDFSTSDLPIVYLDDNVIVINKPAGVLTHSKGALNDEFTVADFFRRYTTFGLDSTRPGVIHRLDRDTSGIIVGARNPETAAALQKQFAERTVKKTYLAVIDGTPKLPTATIDLPIGRNPAAPSTFRVDAKGKAAITTYETLASSEKTTLIKLQPQTGRTHQLRVHMAYIGTPIHGDRVYGKASTRLFLHAWHLEITLPGGQRQTFSAPVPTEFSALFSETAQL